MEKKQFLYLMTRLANAFKEDVSEERFDIYFEFLGNYNYNILERAVNSIIRNNKWFPKIAEIEEYLEANVDDLGAKTRKYLEEMERLEIEYKTEPISTEEARGWLGKIYDSLKPKPLKATLETEEAEEFERKRQIAKEKARRLIQ